MTNDPGPTIRIVCVYRDGALPSAWFQVVQRARRTMKRAGWRARIDLLPASALPSGADVVLAPPGLAEALASSTGRVVVACEPVALISILDGLLERLADEGRLQRGPEPARTIAVHRGFQALGDRARVAE